MSDIEVKFCLNCNREVPAGNFIMHHVHCQRKLALCQKCDEPIPHSELATHNINFHSIISCPDCGSQMEKWNLVDHQSSSCSRRAICCNFCHIETEASELAEHENYCGSRTERCQECGEFVMLKYQQLHEDTNHGFLKLEDEPGPTPSWSTTRSSSSSLFNALSRRKVSNASQDTTRPTSASNRLSPSKRTNDMPQVNSASAASQPKALHKTAIHPDEDTVDLDRLLALRLAEQERSLFSAPTAPLDLDLGSSMSPDLCGDLVALPCEFCEAMIPANQLVIHETGCRPDLAVYKPPPVVRNRKESEPVEDGLPCEFCGTLFPPRNLLQHEATCEVTSPSDNILVNDLGPSRSMSHTPKMRLNLGPSWPSPRLTAPRPIAPLSIPPCSIPPLSIPPRPIAPCLIAPRLIASRRQQPSPTDGHESEDRNPYLMEVRAALNKPTANILPQGRHRNITPEVVLHNDFGSMNHQMNLPSTCVNGYMQRNGSTGAVPKQKAGKRVGIREVPKEVPRSSATAVAPSLHRPSNSDASR